LKLCGVFQCSTYVMNAMRTQSGHGNGKDEGIAVDR
jgi:hypothetical protein